MDTQATLSGERGAIMSSKQTLISIIDTMPESFVQELSHYAFYLKQLSEKEARNSAYVDKIQRGILQCAEGRGLRRDIIEVDKI